MPMRLGSILGSDARNSKGAEYVGQRVRNALGPIEPAFQPSRRPHVDFQRRDPRRVQDPGIARPSTVRPRRPVCDHDRRRRARGSFRHPQKGGHLEGVACSEGKVTDVTASPSGAAMDIAAFKQDSLGEPTVAPGQCARLRLPQSSRFEMSVALANIFQTSIARWVAQCNNRCWTASARLWRLSSSRDARISVRVPIFGVSTRKHIRLQKRRGQCIRHKPSTTSNWR